MGTHTQLSTQTLGTRTKTPGEKLESIAFTFCKAGTLVLLTGRFALPVIASLAAIFFAAAYIRGKVDTRCFLRYPLLLSAIWTAVGLGAWVNMFRPELMPWNR